MSGSFSNSPVQISGQAIPVADFASLPTNVPVGSFRVTLDTGELYYTDDGGTTWTNISSGGGGGGGISSVVNVGGFTGLFRNLTGAGTVANFKTIHSTTGALTFTANANDVDINLATVSIAHGGTGQTNQQAAINNLTDITSHTDGDVFQLLSGNAQFAPLVLSASQINTALGLIGNAFVSTDASGNIFTHSSWQLDDTTHFSGVFPTLQANNAGVNTNIHNWNPNVELLADSPNDSMALHFFGVNLDSTAAGKQFGTAGQAGTILAGGFNYGGNGSSFGSLRHINLFTSIGNGTDPGTFSNGFFGVANGFNIQSGITIDGQVHGYDWSFNVDPAATTTSNFSVLWLSDFSQFPVDVYGYQGTVCSPQIATIKNNHGFTAHTVNPNITLMEGNAGYTGFGEFSNITTLGVSGYNGFYANPNLGTQQANSGINMYFAGGNITTMGANANLTGYSWNVNITTSHGNVQGLALFPNIDGGDADVKLINGNMSQVAVGANKTAVMSLGGATQDGFDSQFAADSVSVNLGGNFIPLSGQTVQTKHVIFTNFDMSGVGAITGTDLICNVMSPQVNFGTITDSVAVGPIGIGVSMVGFAGQLGGHGNIALLNAVTPTAIFQSDFTLGEWRNVNAYVINAGFTGSCTSATAFYHEVAGAGLFATDHWGLKVVTNGIHNYMPAGVQVGGGGTYKTTNTSVALGVSDGALLLPSFDNAGEAGLTGVNGMMIYNTDLNKGRLYENGAWVNLL